MQGEEHGVPVVVEEGAVERRQVPRRRRRLENRMAGASCIMVVTSFRRVVYRRVREGVGMLAIVMAGLSRVLRWSWEVFGRAKLGLGKDVK